MDNIHPKDRNYCESNDKFLLPTPFTESVFNLKIPIYRLGFGEEFNPDYLDNLPEPRYDLIEYSYTLTNRQGSKIIDPVKEMTKMWNFPVDWFIENNKYLLNLSSSDIIKLCGYTYRGDKLVNQYLLNPNNFDSYFQSIINKDHYTDYFPLFLNMKEYLLGERKDIKKYTDKWDELESILSEIDSNNIHNNELYIILTENLEVFNLDFYHFIVESYISDLKRIINSTPPFPEDCIVFRGVTDKYYYKDQKQKEYYNTTFMSTTFNFERTFSFTGKDCCLKKIILKKGDKAIFMECLSQIPGEQEILLPPDMRFEIVEDRAFEWSEPPQEDGFYNKICSHNPNKIHYTILKSL